MGWNFHKPEPGERFEAKFKGMYKAVGSFGKPVYVFENEEKGIFHLWGSVVIKNLFNGVPFGSQIALKYLGMKKTDESRYKMHLYEIEVLRPSEEKEAITPTRRNKTPK